MPDWFYRTASQRILFGLPDQAGRAVALTVIGQLGKRAWGRRVIEFMGHMAPDEQLEVQVAGTKYASPIGLGWRVDPEQRATQGLAGFGVGAMEIYEGWTESGGSVRRVAGEQLEEQRRGRVDHPSPRGGEERDAQRESLGGDGKELRRRRGADGGETVELPGGVCLPVVAWDEQAERGGDVFAQGVVLQVGRRTERGGWLVPAAMPEGLPEQVRWWRARLPEGAALIVAGGVGAPKDAVALVEAGAGLVLVEAGLVFRGPGLVKRCNEALLRRRGAAAARGGEVAIFRRAWIWAYALGAAMFLGGGLTLALALTRVLLPYDEHYLGLTSATLHRTTPRLFAFMAHDRGTLAGTMIGLGGLYMMLAWHGIRRGVHGAKAAVVASALAGFASFFAFFGFGYFDTLHAFVAAVLFQLTVQIMVGEPGGAPTPTIEADEETVAWRRAQWGQLLWVVHATGLLIAGVMILGIGMTSVFVSEDLSFLCMTPAEAQNLGDRVMGVVAHDRATLGGMLLASGVAMLLPVLWCYRPGARWLWRSVAGLGLPAYVAAIGIHGWVGYNDWRHIVPAWIGAALWAGGLGLSWGYLKGGGGEGVAKTGGAE